MFAAFKHFFSDVKGSAPGVLVPEELFRAIVTSLGSGTIIGLVVMILQALLDHVVSIFPDPAIASLASITLTLVLDLLRRQTHGDKPVITPVTPATPVIPVVPPFNPVVPPANPVVPPIIPGILPPAFVEVVPS